MKEFLAFMAAAVMRIGPVLALLPSRLSLFGLFFFECLEKVDGFGPLTSYYSRDDCEGSRWLEEIAKNPDHFMEGGLPSWRYGGRPEVNKTAATYAGIPQLFSKRCASGF